MNNKIMELILKRFAYIYLLIIVIVFTGCGDSSETSPITNEEIVIDENTTVTVGETEEELVVVDTNTTAEDTTVTVADTNTTADENTTTTEVESEEALVFLSAPNTLTNVYSVYQFLPKTNAEDGAIFTIENRPQWATFDTTTGLLQGVPTVEGNSSEIVISVSNGTQRATTAPFSIEVKPALNIAHMFGTATQPPKNDYYYYKEPKYAIDGNLSTNNHTQCSAPNNWLQIELPQNTEVHKIVLHNVEGQTARLIDSTVYLRNENYTGSESVDTNSSLATLNADMTQTIELNQTSETQYLLILGNPVGDNSCLHLNEVAVYAQTPPTPVFQDYTSEVLVPVSAESGFYVATIPALDYQEDRVSYSVDNPAFSIDSEGNLVVADTLDSGRYTLVVTASDGVNSATTPLTINVTQIDALESALRSGSVDDVTETELLEATREEIALLKEGEDLLFRLYDNEINYTPVHSSQLFNLHGDFHKIYSILYGEGGNNLAIAGTKDESRFAAFGSVPMHYFINGENLDYELPMQKLLAWLIDPDKAYDVLADESKTVALSFAYYESETKDWLETKFPNWNIKICSDVTTLTDCLNGVDLNIEGAKIDDGSEASIETALQTATDNKIPTLYLHYGWSINATDAMIADFFGFSMPYGGNWWAVDKAAWVDVASMQAEIHKTFNLDSIDVMLAHFQNKNYNFNWSECKNNDGIFGSEYDNCDEVSGYKSEFDDGASAVQNMMHDLDHEKLNVFAIEDQYRLQKLFALIGDKFRENVVFPMDKVTTDDNTFMRAYYSDHAVYSYRTLAPKQKDMGNFSRSDFSHITPTTRDISFTSKKSFRATGAYALPGQTFRVTRNDDANVTTKVFINTLRAGSTHEFEVNGYKRPKYLQSEHFSINPHESIEITSVYGGPIEIDFDVNDLNVSFHFENVGEHPMWAFWESDAEKSAFSSELYSDSYDWAELVTSGFEVHSTASKMKKSIENERWGSAEALADGTVKYTSNYPLVLAGYKGEGIDVVPEIHDFAAEHNLSVATFERVQHMNADQALCGYGCSGNPYDAYWAFDPIGHGDIHEIGHNLEKVRFRFEGFPGHAITN
jgi:hypothetical protein